MDKNPTRFKDKMSQDEKPSWELHGFEIFNVFRLFHANFFSYFCLFFVAYHNNNNNNVFQYQDLWKSKEKIPIAPKRRWRWWRRCANKKIWPNFFCKFCFLFFSPFLLRLKFHRIHQAMINASFFSSFLMVRPLFKHLFHQDALWMGD